MYPSGAFRDSIPVLWRGVVMKNYLVKQLLGDQTLIRPLTTFEEIAFRKQYDRVST